VLGVPLRRYLIAALLPAAAAAAVPAGLLLAAVSWHRPASWVQLAGYGLAFGTLHAVSALWLLGGAKLAMRQLGLQRSGHLDAAMAKVAEEAHG
jgi:hypothetical protein